MGKTPEAVPRKRRSPFEEDRTGNVNSDLNQHTSDSMYRSCSAVINLYLGLSKLYSHIMS